MKKKLWTWICLIFIGCTLASCNDTIDSVQAFDSDESPRIPKAEKIAEVAPPKLIQELGKTFEQYQPQLAILEPKNDQIIEDTTVKVTLEIKDLPIFKHPDLLMGPHIHFFLDDNPYQAIYSTDEPVVLENLPAGTHTIRAFASRSWHESFKNEGAYAQTTFHVFTPSDDNNPDLEQPLLTYSRPQGNYGAEPIMLDFYLTNAPLHLVAQESSEDAINDWRIRVTVNGENFLMDTWQPLYLKGFHKGKNWVKLEFIDENGEIVKNVFNNTVRVINYDPKLDDTLTRLVKEKISLEEARGIVEPDYQYEPIKEETKIEEETLPSKTENLAPETIIEEDIIEEEIIEPESTLNDIEIENPKVDLIKESSEVEKIEEEEMITQEEIEIKEEIEVNSSDISIPENELEEN